MLKNKLVGDTGNLSVNNNSTQRGLVREQQEANTLLRSYPSNQIQATGNAQNLQLKVNAPALYELYPGLRGRAQGYINMQAQPRLQASANLSIDNFAFKNLMSVQKIRVRGQLPTSQTTATLLTA